MSDRFWQHGIARTAAFMAAVALLLPPVSGGACACVVRGDQPSHAGRQPVSACCAKHQADPQPCCCHRHAATDQSNLHDQVAGGPVCHCQHGQRPETPVVPPSQTQSTVDQLMFAQGAISTPLVPVILPATSAFSTSQELCLAADTSLERCILLSRLTL